MNRRTFEILAKWIAKEQKSKVVFEKDIGGPYATLKDKTVHLPIDVDKDHVFSGLSQLAHEAAHLRYSTELPEDIVKTQISHNILNAIEDIRIDYKNFQLLPNIKEFYEELIKDVHKKKNEIAKMPLLNRCLINGILRNEQFKRLKDDEALEMDQKHNISGLMMDACRYLECRSYDKAVEIVEKIKTIFGITEDPPIPSPVRIGIKQGKGQGPGQAGNGQGGGQGGKEKGGQGSQGEPGLGDIDGVIFGGGDTWGTGHTITGGSADEMSPAALQEQTKKNFKELLNIKEQRTVYEGNQLNTDALTDFFCGKVEGLFKDSEIVRKKRSKIMFLIDASGSMNTPLLDGQDRKVVVTKCIKAFCQILTELEELEGLNVGHEVHAFTDDFHELNQDKWEQEFHRHSGGTSLENGFREIQKRLLQDLEVDGNKLIVVMTDGEVSESEIEEVRQLILTHNQDVRCMIIGVGSPITGHMATEIIGDLNILAEAQADAVIMDAVSTMLT